MCERECMHRCDRQYRSATNSHSSYAYICICLPIFSPLWYWWMADDPLAFSDTSRNIFGKDMNPSVRNQYQKYMKHNVGIWFEKEFTDIGQLGFMYKRKCCIIVGFYGDFFGEKILYVLNCICICLYVRQYAVFWKTAPFLCELPVVYAL